MAAQPKPIAAETPAVSARCVVSYEDSYRRAS
jgi:hypothetical protein